MSGWLNDAQVLSVKLFRHLVSMRSLATRTAMKHDGISVVFVDHASVKVVARAALETYLVFYYIYGQADRSLSEFRHKTWHLAGLLDRQRFPASLPESIARLASEREEIEKLTSEIEFSSHFCSYSPKQQKRLLEGEWRVGLSWVDLGKDAGFDLMYFRSVYSYLCGYAHSSYLSALQVRDAATVEDQEMITYAFLGLGVVLMAHFAFTYSDMFSRAKVVLSAHRSAMNVAEIWRFGPKDMEAYSRGTKKRP